MAQAIISSGGGAGASGSLVPAATADAWSSVALGIDPEAALVQWEPAFDGGTLVTGYVLQLAIQETVDAELDF